MIIISLLISLLPVLISCAPQAHELTSSYRRLGPRYQVLKEYVFSGQKNVRYETRPAQFLDAQGNPLDAAKFVSAGAISGCIDMEGRNHPEGLEYERQNKHFKYRCVNGQEEVAACIGSDRTNNARIPVGQTLDIKGYWHKCIKYQNGSVIYTQGCYFYDNGQAQKLNVGEQRQVGKVTHFCETKGNTLQYYSKGSGGCVKAGKEYSEGDVYLTNHLRYKCQGGIMDVTGCYINENRDLSIGQDIVEKGMVYRCYRLGPKIEYSEYACGFRGTPSCTPPAIPITPDQVPALGRGLSSPGFGSFSIVETVPSSQQVKYPSSLNLGLQKKPLMNEPLTS
uniref:Abnormal cell migration protein 18-like fibronectin type I domain-containing protein n=1 Tax=Meloidogyne hapla TaxID=6305 RepID=A0A1I8BQ54_MELHA